MALDPYSRIEQLLRQQSPLFAAGFQKLILQIKSDIDLKEIADLLATGRLEQALQETLRRVPRLGTLYLGSFVAAAESTAQFLNLNLRNMIIDFDQTNPFAVRMAQQNKLRLITEFNEAQRRATRQAIINGIVRGDNPLRQARNFRDSVGLTRAQVNAVDNYRSLLENGSRDALRRQLRDRRFDRTIRGSIDSGQSLTQQQIDTMVNRYRANSIKHRSEAIARTEALRAVHEGKNASYQQAIDSGDLHPNSLRNEWNTARDERVRDSHLSMHGQTQPFGSPFVSGRGNFAEYPGSFGVASEDIHCRCTVGTRITETVSSPGISVQILQ